MTPPASTVNIFFKNSAKLDLLVDFYDSMYILKAKSLHTVCQCYGLSQEFCLVFENVFNYKPPSKSASLFALSIGSTSILVAFHIRDIFFIFLIFSPFSVLLQ